MKDFSMCSLSVFICVKERERERGREGEGLLVLFVVHACFCLEPFVYIRIQKSV